MSAAYYLWGRGTGQALGFQPGPGQVKSSQPHKSNKTLLLTCLVGEEKMHLNSLLSKQKFHKIKRLYRRAVGKT